MILYFTYAQFLHQVLLFTSIYRNEKSPSYIEKGQVGILQIVLSSVIIIGIALYYNFLQQSKSNEIIAKQNERNELLLKELHHRVKNNMQLMYSLLNLEKRRTQDTDTKMLLASVQNRIHAMSLVHQNLYTSGSFEIVDIKSYIFTLLEHLQLIYKVDMQQIDIVCNMDESIQLPIEKVLSIGLIINESVSNAFKYAFVNRQEGKLKIQITKNQSLFVVKIEDDGPGYLSNRTNENTLGLKLIKVMCAQLKAKYTLTHESGVKHQFEFES
jgi:two-component sensor histidine kinase